MFGETDSSTRYNVLCISCDAVWCPSPGSSLWWRAKKRAETFIDAMPVTASDCGCALPIDRPDAPYRVRGYDGECYEFDKPFVSFTEAVKAYLEAQRGLSVVFIDGVTPAVEARLATMW